VAIADQEARPFDVDGVPVVLPAYMAEIVATLSHVASESAHVNQRSGVSVRLTVSNRETMVANAVRRSLRLGEDVVAPRISDLDALASSTMGKVEVESFEEGREGDIIGKLLSQAVLTVFRDRIGTGVAGPVVDSFDDGEVIHTGEDVRVADYAARLDERPGLAEIVDELAGEAATPAERASAAELVLEGLHLSKRLNKDAVGARATYRGR
jgi:magnesium chelatase subunit I